MKISTVFIITILLIAWESFLGHTRLFAGLDIFAGLFIALFLAEKLKSRSLLLWIFSLGCILDLILGRWIGIYGLAIFIPLVLLILFDRVIKVFQEEKGFLAIVLYIPLEQLIIYSLVIINGARFSIYSYLLKTIVNILIAIIIYWLVNREEEYQTIKV